MSSTLRPDPWLTEALGFRAYVTDAGGDAPPEGERSLTYAKVAASDTASLAHLQDTGFRVVDVNVTLEHDGAEPPPNGDVEVAGDADGDALIDVAGRSFRYSRFHLDPAIPNEAADNVKREWVRSYVHGKRGVELLAASHDGRPVGFLAVLEADGSRLIDLVAVAPEARGRGLGRALVAAFVRRHRGDGRRLLVGTQVANTESLRLYESLGFRVAAANYVVHLHRGV